MILELPVMIGAGLDGGVEVAVPATRRPLHAVYQIRLGQPTPSLDQIAAYEWPRYAAQDTGR